MRSVLWWSAEGVVAAAVVAGLWVGPGWWDAVVKMPSADERLIVAAGDTGPLGAGRFDAALAAGASVNGRDRNGGTALMMAALVGETGRVGRLIELGADVNAMNARGWTALMLAASNRNAAIIELLRRHGADPCLGNPEARAAVAAAMGVE